MPQCKNVPVIDKLALHDDYQLALHENWHDNEGRLIKPIMSNVSRIKVFILTLN